MPLSPDTLKFIEEISSQTSVTIYLCNGVKLTGMITHFFLDSYGLTRDDTTQVVLHQAIATVLPHTDD